MTTLELSRALRDKIPARMACDWDNDGIMCLPEPDRTIHRVLIVLDITDDAVDHAIKGNYDIILSSPPDLQGHQAPDSRRYHRPPFD